MTMFVYATFQMGSGYAETAIIPSADVAGRYDTNIFNRPAALLRDAQGKTPQIEDFVTTVGGAVQLLHETRDVDAKIKVGGNFNAYAENTGLNFFTATLTGQIGLDRWVDQYVRGAKLQIKESFLYTPETPGFVTGVRQIVAQDGTFQTGIQGFRANTFTNTTGVTGSYPLSRDLALEGGYTFALRRVGRILGGGVGGVAFFDTTSHTWHGGPRYQLTKNDSIAAVYRQSFILQTFPGSSRPFSTTLVTLAGDYTKVFQEWKLSVEGGITFIEPAGRSFPSGNLTVSTTPERDTVLHLTLARVARPSIFLRGGAVITNTAVVGVSHKIYERLMFEGTVAYGYNQFFPDTSNSIFQSFTGVARLSYNLTRNITGDVSYQYTHVDNSGSTTEYQFSRNIIGFFLTAEWK
jgi:opacity protein-like surface antigen